MASSNQPVWVAWVNGVRRGDSGALEELTTYFTPFVHGVLIAQLASHAANEQVKLVLDDALRRLDQLNDPAGFGAWLLDAARTRAQAVTKLPGATLELPGGGQNATESKKSLSRIRRLEGPTRERLVFRLLEGITGAEIAEVTGAPESEVRADLERGVAALVKDVSGATVNAAGDPYLWSLVGAPHAAVVPLENQLTPLRYDPTAAEELMTEALGAPALSPDITPLGGPSFAERNSEGRRPTSPEQRVARAPPPADDEPGTTPVGQKLVDGVDPSRAGAPERTQHATELPVAAQANPFAQQPGTIPASDLPAAANVEPRPSRPRRSISGETRGAAPDAPLGVAPPNPTEVRPRNPEVPAPPTRRLEREESSEDPDTTAPRGVPLSVLSAGYEAPSTGSSTPSEAGQDWRTSVIDVSARPAAPAKPQPFSLTRGATPFVVAALFFTFFLVVAYINLRGTERTVRRGWNLVPVTVAAQNIAEGSAVDFDMISTREVPEQFVTASVVKPDSAAYIVNQRIMVPVQAGDPLLWSQFETARASERLSRRVNKRGRAYTIEAKSITSVGGWVRPGDHVDLIISVRDENTRQRTSSTTLQNITILATGKLTQSTNIGLLKKSQQEYSTVSVLALPEEIEILALMREKANYRMVLRNDEDFEPVELGRSTPDTLINGERVEMLRKKRSLTIQMIRSSPKGSDPTQQPRR